MSSTPELDQTVAGACRPPLRQVLDLEQIDSDTSLGHSFVEASRIYGGQAVGQAVVAAARTAPADRPVHSVHGSFLHPGDPSVPVQYNVNRLRDGGSFTTRGVLAEQSDRPIFTATVSFQRVEGGLTHQVPVSAPARSPEDLPEFDDSLTAEDAAAVPWLSHLRGNVAADFKFPEEYPRLANARGESRPPVQRAWIRASEPLGDDPVVHAAAFAYLSDLFLLSSALSPHTVTIEDDRLQLASLDHTVWFHEQFRIDEWRLYEQEGSWMGHGRGLCRGHLYDRNGLLLASTSQEGLLRLR
ncbi:acyl-CoA thioesterase [Gordonia sp. KTR9]|uniref:acyl-CoA thioesterase n=1 Tax=Gordonia sp. KTR9 TaxID=337191 RepID=UPI00027DE9FC|nr:acyl-CoA thioesterase domain-containing protein [Gordonia sp. KTR9]AFR49439.1 Acyl-CoA thioesterase [Gordonia sp. KTR9]